MKSWMLLFIGFAIVLTDYLTTDQKNAQGKPALSSTSVGAFWILFFLWAFKAFK